MPVSLLLLLHAPPLCCMEDNVQYSDSELASGLRKIKLRILA